MTQKLPLVEQNYEVSFVFDLLSRSAEEVAAFANYVVDHLFKVTNSQLEAPSYFYRAMMFAGVQTISDPELRDKVSFYTHECFDKVLPMVSAANSDDRLDLAFANRTIDGALADIQATETLTCLDLKNEVKNHLKLYAREKTRRIPTAHIGNWGARINTEEAYLNHFASQSLVNHYLSSSEGVLGVRRDSMAPGTTARIFQYLNRVFSWDGLLHLVGFGDKQGAALTAVRSQKFSEHLQRAPHIQGFAKMVLIAVFPWLVFFVIVGRWKILLAWLAVYFSVLMWAPIWSLSYHIVTNIALSAETMAALGKLSDGISLYSSQLITSRLYHFYALYAWIQILVGPLPTALLAWKLAPIIRDDEQESAPQFIGEAKQASQKIIA